MNTSSISKLGLVLLFLTTLIIAPTFIRLGNKDPKPEMSIFLISNNIHVGLALPVKNQVMDWHKFIDPKDFAGPVSTMEWIEFGWGDRRFYFEMPSWEQFTIALAADALFLPDPAVMHVEYLAKHPKSYSMVREVKVSYETYEKIVKSVQKWFVLKNGEAILIPKKGYSSLDNFYEAKGSYSIIKTCNNWTAGIFAEAGLIHPLWSPTKYGMEMSWELNKQTR